MSWSPDVFGVSVAAFSSTTALGRVPAVSASSASAFAPAVHLSMSRRLGIVPAILHQIVLRRNSGRYERNRKDDHVAVCVQRKALDRLRAIQREEMGVQIEIH